MTREEFVIPFLDYATNRYYLSVMTPNQVTARLARTEALRMERAALRVKLATEMGRSPFDRQVIREANAQLRNAGRLSNAGVR